MVLQQDDLTRLEEIVGFNCEDIDYGVGTSGGAAPAGGPPVSIVKTSTMVLQQFAGEFLADDGRVPIVKESTMVLQRRDRGSVEHARLEFQL